MLSCFESAAFRCCPSSNFGFLGLNARGSPPDRVHLYVASKPCAYRLIPLPGEVNPSRWSQSEDGIKFLQHINHSTRCEVVPEPDGSRLPSFCTVWIRIIFDRTSRIAWRIVFLCTRNETGCSSPPCLLFFSRLLSTLRRCRHDRLRAYVGSALLL